VARWPLVGVAEKQNEFLKRNTKMDTEESKHELSSQLAGARSVTAADLAGGSLPARLSDVQSHQLNSSGAQAPELAVDGFAVQSAAFAGPSEDLINGSAAEREELEDLLGALEEVRAALDLARGDLSLIDWRVDDMRRELSDELEASGQLRGAALHARWAVSQADSAVEDLVAVLDARIAVRREQLKGGAR